MSGAQIDLPMKSAPPRLDDYCRSQCQEMRCDADRDCPMLKFRRKREVQGALNEVVRFLETRHTAVRREDLVQRFFVNARRHGLDPLGTKYLEGEFDRLLDDALQRDRRVERRRLTNGIAWARRGSGVADPDQVISGAAVFQSLDMVDAMARISGADHPIALTHMVADEIPPGGQRAELEERLAAALGRQPGLRAVAVDPRRGIGTCWTTDQWVRMRLPCDVFLSPVVITAMTINEWPEDEEIAPWAETELDHGPEATRFYPITIDDVLCGSIVLDSCDAALFPAQPNPTWLEIHDETGGIYGSLLLERDGTREIFGLRELFFEVGTTGMGIRLRPTLTAHIFLAEAQPVETGDNLEGTRGDDPLSRRLWRHLLEAGDWRSVQELAVAAGATTQQAGAVLAVYRCFERSAEGNDLVRLDPSQRGLRRAIRDRRMPATTEDPDSLLHRTLIEVRELLITARQVEREVSLLEERAIQAMTIPEMS